MISIILCSVYDIYFGQLTFWREKSETVGAKKGRENKRSPLVGVASVLFWSGPKEEGLRRFASRGSVISSVWYVCESKRGASIGHARVVVYCERTSSRYHRGGLLPKGGGGSIGGWRRYHTPGGGGVGGDTGATRRLSPRAQCDVATRHVQC